MSKIHKYCPPQLKEKSLPAHPLHQYSTPDGKCGPPGRVSRRAHMGDRTSPAVESSCDGIVRKHSQDQSPGEEDEGSNHKKMDARPTAYHASQNASVGESSKNKNEQMRNTQTKRSISRLNNYSRADYGGGLVVPPPPESPRGGARPPP